MAVPRSLSPEEAADYDGDCGGAVMGWGMGWVTQDEPPSVSKMAVRPETHTQDEKHRHYGLNLSSTQLSHSANPTRLKLGFGGGDAARARTRTYSSGSTTSTGPMSSLF